MLDGKKTLQSHLANDYGDAARRKQMRLEQEKLNSINVDKAINTRVNKEQEYLDVTEQKKKKYIQEMYKNEKKLYDLEKQNERQRSQMVRRENQNQLSTSERQSDDRANIFKNRYNYFNNFQEKVSNDYRKFVLSPENEKKSKIDTIISKQVSERNKKLEDIERHKKTFYENWNHSTKNAIIGQMSHKQSTQTNEKEKTKREQIERYMKETEVSNIDFIEQQQK